MFHFSYFYKERRGKIYLDEHIWEDLFIILDTF